MASFVYRKWNLPNT